MSENNDGFAVPAPRKPAKASNSSSSDPATAESSSSASASKSSQPTPPPLLYTKPNWGAVAQYDYGFEVLKCGVSIDRYKGPRKDFITIGRLPLCDMQMEHPSVSRYHAVVQFNQDGAAFIYDLESAHGTLLNKQRIHPKTHVPLRPGDQLKFGESTRIYIFESDKEQEEESETEIAVRHRSTAADVEHTAEGDDEEEGINWGFREDAPEEPDVDEEATGDASLIDVEAEKKMAEDAKRRRDELDIMYGDESEEEALYDKTGGRKKKKAKKKKKAETYDDLVARKKETEKEIAALEAEIEDRKKKDAAAKAEAAEMGDEGDLDAYMVMLKKQSQTQDLVPIHRLQTKLTQLKKDHERLEKLVKLTKPSDIFGM